MSEYFEEAVNELKRADHMIFVSLKYTRTCDVIKNIVDRLISCYDHTFDYLIEHLKEQKKIDEIPPIRTRKIDLLTTHFKDNQTFIDFMQFYGLMRRINKAEFTRRQEFRRHVTMTVILEDQTVVELNIDSIHEYYLRTKSFVDFAHDMIKPKEE